MNLILGISFFQHFGVKICVLRVPSIVYSYKSQILVTTLKNITILLMISTLFAYLWADESKNLDTLSQSAIKITLEEMVDPGMAAYTKRAIEEAAAQKPDIIFLEVNTFGGRLDAAFDIVDAITSVEHSKTIALVNKKAISAGALISLAADEMYMKENTTIGDCAPIIQGQDGPKMLGEKIQSPLRAKFRGLAQKNGYNELLSMAMVSENLEVLKLTNKDSMTFMQAHRYEELSDTQKAIWTEKTTLVREGELLTLTNSEAQDLGFSKGTVKNIDSLYSKLNIQATQKLDISWSESMVRALGGIAPILILIGFGALYIEIKTPGFGVFGITGIICLALVFGGQHLVGMASNMGAVFFGLGVILIVVEMFVIPGTWLAGLAGIVCFIVALSLSTELPQKDSSEFFIHPQFFENVKDMIYLSIAALLFPIFFAKYVLPKLSTKAGIILNETLEEAKSADLSLGYKIGQEGETLNLLKPTGRVNFDSQEVEVQAISGYIDEGKRVRICSLNNHQIWVEEIS